VGARATFVRVDSVRVSDPSEPARSDPRDAKRNPVPLAKFALAVFEQAD
jgi:hypothetical protein